MKPITTQKQKALQNVKLSAVVREFLYNVLEYKGENNAV